MDSYGKKMILDPGVDDALNRLEETIHAIRSGRNGESFSLVSEMMTASLFQAVARVQVAVWNFEKIAQWEARYERKSREHEKVANSSLE